MKVDNLLYIIGTPLGNLEDITLRARQVLAQCNHLFAEDTRELAKLFNLLGISLEGKKLHSYSAHNMKEATELALNLLEKNSIGLVSDRGMPAISDPGAVLVEEAIRLGKRVIPVPGPSALTTIFSVSGISQTDFHFVGFLPSSHKQRKELWEKLRNWASPLCFFESPKRIEETITELQKEFPNGKVFIGREMTKQFEEFYWIDLKNQSFNLDKPMGEFTAILVPGDVPLKLEWEEELMERVLSDKEWSKKVSQRHGCAASEVYNALQRVKKNQ